MKRTTGAARMSTRTQAVDHLQDPSTTLRPIPMFGLFRGFRVQYFPIQKGAASFPLAHPSCRVDPITGNEPRPGRLGILTVIARKRAASPYRALIFLGRLEPCIAVGGHVRLRIIRDVRS